MWDVRGGVRRKVRGIAEHSVCGRTRVRAAWKSAVCAMIVAAFPTAAAMAQEGGVGSSLIQDRRGETVSGRARPDYDHRGVRIGAFTVRVGVSEDFGYDDNVTSAHADPKGSPVFISRGGVAVTPTWQRHALAFTGEIRDQRYPDASGQGYTNWGAGLAGRYEIEQGSRLFGGYRHDVLHETLDDPNAGGADRPIRYTRDTVRAGVRYGFNRLYIQPFAALIASRYDDATFAGQPVSQAYRDRDVWFGRLEVGYEVSPRRAVFVATHAVRSNYLNPPAPGVAGFDNVTWELVGGLDYDSDGIWNYRVSAGVRRRAYDSDARKAVNGLALDALATWRPTPMTTVSGAASTAIEDGSAGNDGYRDNVLALRVDHEYLRNVLLHARARVRYIDYLDQDRDTVTLTGEVGVDYLLNRVARLGAGYEHTKRFADRPRDEFDRNIVLLRLSVGL